MKINKSEKQELLEMLNEMLERQAQFQQEINDMQVLINSLEPDETEPVEVPIVKTLEPEKKEFHPIKRPPQKQQKQDYFTDFLEKTGISSEIEQFIGTNLINKIGMIVVIIGVGIGAKYAIDNDLISPVMRIILGYLVGGILTFFALRLKTKYFNFSAVLFSGAMAIHYFITYAAYTYYGLYPHSVTFILMVLFTVFTVGLALYYDRQVIAHFGLTGAYITPFLLADPDSSALVLFTYMFIINLGILYISTKKRWKPLNYVAFVATWVIFLTWFASDKYNDQLAISLTFTSGFFIIFYLVFLSYKLILKEKFRVDDIFFLLLNSLVFYLIGIESITNHLNDNRLEGLFTFINVIIHSLTALLIYKSKKENDQLFFWTIGMVIAFATLAIGLQFNQYYTAILWSVEAAFLFWLGRDKKIILFDYISFSIICIVLIQIIVNWMSVNYNFSTNIIKQIYTPFISLEFLSSLIVIGSFFFIFHAGKKRIPEEKKDAGWLRIFNIFFPSFFLIILFFTFYTEIDLYWNNIQVHTSFEINADGYWEKAYEQINYDIFKFKSIWLINYSIFFISLLDLINFRWLKNELLNELIFAMAGIMVVAFLLGTLQNLIALRNSYLSENLPPNYDVNIFHLLIRYVAYLFCVLLFYSVYKFSLPFFTNKNIQKIFEIVLSVTIIWICSSELIHWLSLSGSTEVYKHSLSILWGILSFILIGYGIWKKKKHLRITSILLFGGTIIKLFVYDLTNLETVPKTIVFISIGALLLVVSFMYNKYKDLIFGKDEP